MHIQYILNGTRGGGKVKQKRRSRSQCANTLDIWVRAREGGRGGTRNQRAAQPLREREDWFLGPCNLLAARSAAPSASGTGCQRQDQNQLQGSIQNTFYTHSLAGNLYGPRPQFWALPFHKRHQMKTAAFGPKTDEICTIALIDK